MASVIGKSQFDVWGAAIMTYFGISGSRPDLRHPNIFKTNSEMPWSRFLKMGMSKMV
jgi:hypothetical protein